MTLSVALETVAMCWNQLWGCSLLGVDLAKGKGKVKRLKRNISVWHINLGKYVYTLSLFFFWCFHFPTKWSLLSYSTVTSALEKFYIMPDGKGSCDWKQYFHVCELGIRDTIRCQGENLACLPCQAKTDVFYPFLLHHEKKTGDVLGGPVVKTSSSNAGDAGSIPGQGVLRSHMPKKTKHKRETIF